MRTIRTWPWAAAILLGVQGVATLAADDDTPPDNRPPGFKSGFRGPFKDAFEPEKPKAAPKKAPKVVQEKPPPKKVIVTTKGVSTTIVDEAAAERAQEESVLLRRLKACDKLKEIALARNDQDLFQRAEQLDERARATYAQRTAYLKQSGSEFETDEKTIERALAKNNKKDDAAITVSGADRAKQAQAGRPNP